MMRFVVMSLVGTAALAVALFILPQRKEIEDVRYETETRMRQIDGMLMVYIPGGEFEMGSSFFESIVLTNSKLFFCPDQGPKHKVYLDAYWIDQTEVTGVSPYRNPAGPDAGSVRVQRGGAWYDGEAKGWVNCVVRHQNPPYDRYEDVGFRCVIPAEKGDIESVE
jgi:formylglycine-generating enzyme required for sulfatase activity